MIYQSNHACMIIAEIAQAHDGSLGTAHRYIDEVAKAGADAIKFQIHFAEEESTVDDVFRPGVEMYDKSRYEYWSRIGFTIAQWYELAAHAADNDIKFVGSAFSVPALKLLTDLNVPFFKIASGEIDNWELMNEVIGSGKPILMSTGMSSWHQIDCSVQKILEHGADLALMQCTSKYPTPLDQVGLNIISELRIRYDLDVGLSDHSGTLYPSLVAIADKVSFVELHVVMDKRLYGPDTSSSISIDQLEFLVNYRNAVEEMYANSVDKDAIAESLESQKTMFGRGLALRKSLNKGVTLAKEDVCLKKPGNGIKASQVNQVLGKKLIRDVSKNRLLRWDDLGD